MKYDEVIDRIKSGNFAGEHGFDLQLLVNLIGTLGEMLRNGYTITQAQEPRVMTLEEVKSYLAEPDGDKKPLWLEWSTIPALSGWVLPSQVADLMKRYLDAYGVNWRPWTSRPTDVQMEAVKWNE